MNDIPPPTAGPRGPTATPPPSAPATATRAATAPAVDTAATGAAAPNLGSVPPLPPGNGPIDYPLAGSAMRTVADNVGVDFAHLAALMMQIDSEIARASRDAESAEIQSVASEMHASADHVRESAKLALAGGVISGATQIGAAGISIGGGIQGMRLTSTSAAMEPATVPEPNASPSGEAAAGAVDTTASVAPPENVPPASEGAQSPGEDTPAETVEEASSAKRKLAARHLDHTLSQQMSARSQNVALMTEGLAKLSTATGEMIKSALDYESRQQDADSKDTDARAEEQRAYLERTKSFADSMQKGAQDMLQIFQQMDESTHQTNKAVWARA